MRLHFRLRWIPLIATVIVAGLGIALGNWQTRRAEEKIAMADAITERAQRDPVLLSQLPDRALPEEFSPVRARGAFVADWPLYLDNRPLQGQAGFYLAMPFRLKDSEKVILVLRGWFPRDKQDRQRLPAIPVPAGDVDLIGVVRLQVGQVMELGESPPLQSGTIVQNLDIGELAVASRLPLQNFIIEQTNDLNDGLMRDWPVPSSGIDTHRGYAFQWYALAAAAVLFFIVTGFRRASKPDT